MIRRSAVKLKSLVGCSEGLVEWLAMLYDIGSSPNGLTAALQWPAKWQHWGHDAHKTAQPGERSATWQEKTYRTRGETIRMAAQRRTRSRVTVWEQIHNTRRKCPYWLEQSLAKIRKCRGEIAASAGVIKKQWCWAYDMRCISEWNQQWTTKHIWRYLFGWRWVSWSKPNLS